MGLCVCVGLDCYTSGVVVWHKQNGRLKGMSECEICEDTGEIIVGCLMTEEGEIIPIITAPCPRCREYKKGGKLA